MALSRRRRNTVAFTWTATFLTALASLIVLLYLVVGHNGSLLIPTKYLYAQTDGSLAFRLSYGVLALVVLAQVLLLWTANLGRFRWIIPVGVEVAVCIVFSLATWRLLRGYSAVGICTGPANCAITFPSPLIALTWGVGIGVALGVAWRLCWKADERRMGRSPTPASEPSLAR